MNFFFGNIIFVTLNKISLTNVLSSFHQICVLLGEKEFFIDGVSLIPRLDSSLYHWLLGMILDVKRLDHFVEQTQ